MCGKNFSIYDVHIPRKSCPSPPPLKTASRSFRKSVSNKTEGWVEAMICSINIQSENVKMTWNISLFPFSTITIFLNVMALATILKIISIK